PTRPSARRRRRGITARPSRGSANQTPLVPRSPQFSFGFFSSTATVPSARPVMLTASQPWFPSWLSAATDAEAPGARVGGSNSAGGSSLQAVEAAAVGLPELLDRSPAASQ